MHALLNPYFRRARRPLGWLVPACLLGCLLAWFAQGPALAFAQQPAGSPAGVVAALSGAAWAENAENPHRDLAEQSPVFSGDAIVTGSDGRLQILFADESVLAQGPDSRTRIDDYVYTPQGAGNRMRLGLAKGALRIISGKIAAQNPEAFALESPLAVLGIRGTMTGHLLQVNEEHHYSLDLPQGHSVVVDGKAGGQAVLVQPEWVVDLAPGLPVPPPRPAEPQELLFIERQTALDSLSQMSSLDAWPPDGVAGQEMDEVLEAGGSFGFPGGLGPTIPGAGTGMSPDGGSTLLVDPTDKYDDVKIQTGADKAATSQATVDVVF